ncbi:MAG TPA: cytochrome c [Polyangiaceae bacterium]|nr:cytochrome c [Polyangiaceae bacterium]
MSLTAAASAGCKRTPSDLREWTADDHDRADEQQKGRAAPPRTGQVAPSPSGSAAANAQATLVEVTWRNQCTPCHGLTGQGDGPQSPMVHAPDLTRPEWQGKVSNEDIAKVITTGKNRMPKFEFPPDVVAGLVSRIRASKGR